MTDNGYLEKIQAMTDRELSMELEKVLRLRADGYARVNQRCPFDLFAEASLQLCENAIRMIKEEQNKRRKRL